MGLSQSKQFTSALGRFFPIESLMPFFPLTYLVPLYHTVSDSDLPHIKHLYKHKTSSEFEADLEFLSKHFEFVEPETFFHSVNKNRKGKRPCLLTFDDGLKEFYEVVAPILSRKGIPAICFLNSDFVDNRGLMYRYQASLLVEALEKSSKAKQSQLAERLDIPSEPLKLQQAILALSHAQEKERTDTAQLLEVSFEQFLNEEKPYLSFAQIKELSLAGFAFGAHSASHPLYAKISEKEQLKETEESLSWLQSKLPTDIPTFAFPFTDDGVKDSFFKQLQRKHSKLYSFGTAGIKKEPQAHHFQRLPMEQGNLSAPSILKGELLSYIFKLPFGRHKMKRDD
ncbi:MAG: polysaccharide deacetylase family protein [Vicingaceae bacterium]